MTRFTAGHVTVEMHDDLIEFEGKPDRDSSETVGSAQAALLTTPDGLDALMGVVRWPAGQVDVRVIHFESGAAPYQRLSTAGTMNLKVVDGMWIARVRAMKVNGREWATLNRVTWGDLNWLAGEDFQSAARSHGVLSFGTYGELTPSAGRAQANDLALKCESGNAEAIAYLYAVTRVEAVMQQFGINGPKGIF